MKEEPLKEYQPFSIKEFADGGILLKNTDGWILLKKEELQQLREILNKPL